MYELQLGVRDPRPTGGTAIGSLLVVADTAVANMDVLPRAVLDAAVEADVLTPTLPGRLAWPVDRVERFRHVAGERLDTLLEQLRREVRGAVLDR
jgi:hypothetical protein